MPDEQKESELGGAPQGPKELQVRIWMPKLLYRSHLKPHLVQETSSLSPLPPDPVSPTLRRDLPASPSHAAIRTAPITQA